MRVLIVAKTRMGGGACIGAIALDDGRSVRLIDAYVDAHDGGGMHYQVGETWDIDVAPPADTELPHTEDVMVRASRRVGQMDRPASIVARHMPPAIGGVEALFDGRLQRTPGGALYVAASSGLPPFSTCFWRPDRPLRRVETGHRIRYIYAAEAGAISFAYVGFQDPLPDLPAGALVRLSLARPWRPEDRPGEELRCYAQLSGWLALDGESELPAIGRSSQAPLRAADMAHAHSLLSQVFGYGEFRPLQESIIASVLCGQDALAIMPTGSGKSICYQLPALIFDGPTIVVTPLIALMQDQVEQLRQLDISAVFLNSTLDHHAYTDTTAQIRSGAARLIYLAPETLLRPETLVMLEGCRPACLAIDEAHCISEWGHDFRPEYRQLLGARRRFPQAVCLALTATATPRVQSDIRQMLHLGDNQTFIASFNRPNLFLAVRPRADGVNQVLRFLTEHKGESGIVYCNTRKQVDELVAQVDAQRFPVVAYHAGLDNAVRAANQRRFLTEDGCIAVATIAFGMGINKPDVRFIVHYNLPGSIEHYYQQIGRAGRDGLQAHCLLLYHPKDLGTHYFHIEEGAVGERPGRAARLQAMDRLARTRECRRAPLLAYFGEERRTEGCDACDNCLAGTDALPLVEVTIEAQKFLSCVKRTGQTFGIAYVIDVLRGSRCQAVLARHHDRLSTYGIGKEHATRTWRQLAQEFMLQGLLEQDLQHGGLRLTDASWSVLRGQQEVNVPSEVMTGQTASVATAGTVAYDPQLFARLRILRRTLADELHIPAYAVFGDRTLIEMATRLPQRVEDLQSVYGVGEFKLKRFGARFVECIRVFCREEQIDPERRALSDLPSAVKRRFEEVGELFEAGRTIAELQNLFGVRRGTIVNHLERYQAAGRPVDPRHLIAQSELAPELQHDVLETFAADDTTLLGPIFAAYGGAVSYDELRLLRLYLTCRRTGGEQVDGESISVTLRT